MAEVTTQSSTMSEVTTESSTMAEVTTEPSTMSEVTTESSTMAEVTTESSTMVEVTTEPSTMSEVTTQPSTMAEVTTQPSTMDNDQDSLQGSLEVSCPLQESSQESAEGEIIQPVFTAAYLNDSEQNLETVLTDDSCENNTGEFTVIESVENVTHSSEIEILGGEGTFLDVHVKSEPDDDMIDFENMVTFYDVEDSDSESHDIKQENLDDNLYNNVDNSLNHEVILSTEFEQKFICEEPYLLETDEIDDTNLSTVNNVDLMSCQPSNKRKQLVASSSDNCSESKKRKITSKKQLKRVRPHYPSVSNKVVQRETINKIYKTRYFCPECNMHYVSTKVASQHISIFHPELDYLEAIENILSKDIEYLQCDLCPQLICGEVKLQEHKQKFHNVSTSELITRNKRACSVDSEATVECTSVSKPDYQCNFCHCSFVSARLLNCHKCSHFSENTQNNTKNNFEYEIVDEPMSFISKEITETPYANYSKRSSKWKCNYCPQNFNDKYLLRDHVDAKHVNNEYCQNNVNKSKSRVSTVRYFCPECGEHFASRNDVTAHLKYVHQTNDTEMTKKKIVCKTTEVWSCVFCPDVFCYEKNLKNHIALKHTIPEESNTEYEVVDSYRNSSDDENTNAVFTSDEENDAGNNLVYQCKLCVKYFPDENQLNQHEKLHASVDLLAPSDRILKTRYHCPECKSNFAKRGTVVLHIRLSHPQLNHKLACNKIVSKPTQIWQCTLCKNMSKFVYFQRKGPFDKHMKHAHSIPAQNKIQSKPSSGQLAETMSSVSTVMKKGEKITKKRYYCLYCDKHFSNISSMSFHNRSSHPEKAGQKTCKIVSKEIWQCSYCRKHFVNKFLLEKHVQTFHSKSKDNQIKHKKIETTVIATSEWGNKITQTRYNCLHCTKHFACPSYVAVHCRLAHSDVNKDIKQMFEKGEREIWQCTSCKKHSSSKYFESELFLQKHVQRFHSSNEVLESSPSLQSKHSNSRVKNSLKKSQPLIIDTCEWGNEVLYRRFSCTACPKHFCSMGTLVSHNRDAHPKIKGRDKFKMIDVPLWECKFCKKYSNIKYYENKFLLKKHVQNFHSIIIPIDESEEIEPSVQNSDETLDLEHKTPNIGKRKRCKTKTNESFKKLKEAAEAVNIIATCEWGNKIIQTRYYCVHCTKNFASISYLMFHVRETHSKSLKEVDYKTGDTEKWQCKLCSKYSNVQYHDNQLLLEEHVEKFHSVSTSADHSGEVENNSQHKNESSNKKQKNPSSKKLKVDAPKSVYTDINDGYYCMVCDQDFANESSLLAHNRVSHPESGTEIWQCTSCPVIKKFDNKFLLEKHIQTFHSNKSDLNLKHSSQLALESTNKPITKKLSITLERLKHKETVSTASKCNWGNKIIQTRYHCTNCSKHFASYSSVLAHNHEKHYKIKRKIKYRTAEKEIWECKLCKKYSNVKFFDNIFLLQKHVQTLHSSNKSKENSTIAKNTSINSKKSKINNKDGAKKSSGPNKTKAVTIISSCPWGNLISQTRFYCLYCPKNFATRCYMSFHNKQSHPQRKNMFREEENEIWECTSCKKTSNIKYFEKQPLLKEHFQKFHLKSTEFENSTEESNVENIKKLEVPSVAQSQSEDSPAGKVNTLNKITKNLYYCLTCNKHFCSSSAVSAHYRVSHPKVKCQFKYKKVAKEMWHCVLCKNNSNTKYFLRMSMLNKHIKVFHEAKVSKSVEIKNSDTEIVQKKQSSVSIKESPIKKMATVYLCPKCHKPFICTDKLYSHLETSHEIIYSKNETKLNICKKRMCMAKCKFCPEYFYYKSSLKRHELECQSEINYNFKCSECDEMFDVESQLEDHVSSVHPEGDPSGAAAPEEHYYLCDICSELCDSRDSLAEHVAQSHGAGHVDNTSDQVSVDNTSTLDPTLPDNPQDANSVEESAELPFETPEALNRFLSSIESINVISYNDHCYAVLGSENVNDETAVLYKDDGNVHNVEIDNKVEEIQNSSQNDLNVTLIVNKFYFCKYCDKKFKYLKRYLKHENSHLNSGSLLNKIKKRKPNICETCSLTFVNKILLKQHNLEFHEQVQCTSCKKFYDKNRRNEHLKTHDDTSSETVMLPLYSMNYTVAFESLHDNKIPILLVHTCTSCNEKFMTQEDYQSHYDNVHSFDANHFTKIIPVDSVENLEDIYLCKLCNSRFNDPRFMYLHTFKHPSFTKSNHICTVCNIKFTNPTDISEHCLHVHSDKQPFKCKICFTSFDYHSKLRTHVRQCHDRPMIHCLHCELDMSKEKFFNKHLQRHVDKIKNECPFCLKSFPTSENTSSHIENHINCEPLFFCETCMNFYYNQQNLDSHIKSVHGNGLFQCELCLTEFISKKAVKNHITIKHIPSAKPLEFASVQDLLENFAY